MSTKVYSRSKKVAPPGKQPRQSKQHLQLPKCPTGIHGFDEITGGGLPLGRPSLVCGGAGAGKTLFSLEFLIRGAREFGEPGVFVAFEETGKELADNVASLGFRIGALVASRKILIDHINIERSEIEETGEYDLEGLFVRLGYAIDAIGAKRVVLDTIESLFASLPNELTVRAELRRLFRWLKDKGVTAIITGERGERTYTRHGLEEYVSDCVILLDHRIHDDIATRRLRIAKYRGSEHGTNEYPFLIDEDGMSVLPITSLELGCSVSQERMSTGIADLDAMLGGKGYIRGSSVLISGPAGTGKTSLAAACAEAACLRGERVLYLAFEESEGQITRNMHSIGIDLDRWIKKGLLSVRASRPSVHGLEMHLVAIHKLVDRQRPDVVVIDPISDLGYIGDSLGVRSMLTRLVDFLKVNGATALCTSLSATEPQHAPGELAISSLMDTWILVGHEIRNGCRGRNLSILKSRGMAHSSDVREFVMTDSGIRILESASATARPAPAGARR